MLKGLQCRYVHQSFGHASVMYNPHIKRQTLTATFSLWCAQASGIRLAQAGCCGGRGHGARLLARLRRSRQSGAASQRWPQQRSGGA